MSSGISLKVARIAVKTVEVNNDDNYCEKRQHLNHTYCMPEVVEKCLKPFNTDNNEKETDVNSSVGNKFLNLSSTSRYESETMKVPTAGEHLGSEEKILFHIF